jgi:hypothetical protein
MPKTAGLCLFMNPLNGWYLRRVIIVDTAMDLNR